MKNLSFLLLFVILFNCQDKQKKETEKINYKSKLSAVKKHPKFADLNSGSDSKIANWKQYRLLKEFIVRFQNISPNEALSNALELKKLVEKLKDSITPKILRIPAFKARVNVLENEALRLEDMTEIPAITQREVDEQVGKILSIYGSINQKINAVYSIKNFEDAIKVNQDSSIYSFKKIVNPGKAEFKKNTNSK